MPPAGSAFAQLHQHLHHTRLLGSISSALYYDQNTVMPAAGAAWRGEQLALLAGQLHARQSSAEYAELVAAAEAELGADAPPQRRRNLQLLRLELERQRCLDPALVAALAKAQSRGNAVWQDARARNDFAAFAPALQELIALRRQQASQLAAAEPVARSPWEILAQPFEPDVSKARLEQLFAPLKAELPALLEQLAPASARAADSTATATAAITATDLPEPLQEQLCAELLESWGYDPRRCQRARSAHPFSCTVGPQDFRITTRVVPGQPLSAFLAMAHEWGHSLYEQGLPRTDDHFFPWPLGEATSMGVHESQSLFWECRVARSRAFAERWYPRFRAGLAAGAARDSWGDAFGFWRALNPLRPGLIRVEADELSYCLHIVLRYELELALLEEEMPVEELPGQWNQRMHDLLGIRPATDAEGCLQDIHWAEGLFGYFPSYALGHLISAQLSETLEQQHGPIEQLISAGEQARLRDWLGATVWPLGRTVNGEELVERVSGHSLSAQPFLTYLRAKVSELTAGPLGTARIPA
jgi:carboxypeptidase Taq